MLGYTHPIFGFLGQDQMQLRFSPPTQPKSGLIPDFLPEPSNFWSPQEMYVVGNGLIYIPFPENMKEGFVRFCRYHLGKVAINPPEFLEGVICGW